jgi:hypothetical protein
MKLSKKGIILEQGNRIRGENVGWLIPWEYFEQKKLPTGTVAALDLPDHEVGSYGESLEVVEGDRSEVVIRASRRRILDALSKPEDHINAVKLIIDLTESAEPLV